MTPYARVLLRLLLLGGIVLAALGVVRLLLRPDDPHLRLTLAQSGPVMRVAITADGACIAAMLQDGTLTLWSVAQPQPVALATNGEQALRLLRFTADDRLLLGGGPTDILAWEMPTGHLRYRIPVPTNPRRPPRLTALAVHPTEPLAVAGTEWAELIVFETQRGTVLRHWRWNTPEMRAPANPSITSPIWRLAFTADGTLLAAGTDSGDFAVWNLADGRLLHEMHYPGSYPEALAFQPDDRALLTAFHNIIIVPFDNTPPVQRTSFGVSDMPGAAFTWEGRFFVRGGDTYRLDFGPLPGMRRTPDATLYLYAVATGQEVGRLQGHRDAITVVDWTRDGRFLVSGSRDGTVRLWETQPIIAPAPTAQP